MENYHPAKLLRLHFTERDRHQGKPLYEAIVGKCQELKIAGATVFRGLEGYGDTAEIHRSHIFTHDLPIVVQIVDSEENIQRLLPVVEDMMDKGLIAMSDVSVVRIQKGAKVQNVEKILVAHDGSDGAQKAFDAAVELASRLHASLHMISVEENLPRYAETTMMEIDEVKEAEDTYFGQLAVQAKRRAGLHSVPLECLIVSGHQVKAIVDFAAQGGFDLLVVGFTGHSAVYEHLWGGTSHNLARMAHCSVFVVK